MSGEISDDVGTVTLPESLNTLISSDALEAVTHSEVGSLDGTCFEECLYILKSELDDLDGGCEGLGDGGRDTAHKEIDEKVSDVVLLSSLLLGHVEINQIILLTHRNNHGFQLYIISINPD